jgi:hypothetical protein
LHTIPNHAVDARLANGHNSCQINSKLNVLLDHSLYAAAEKSNQLTDTLVRNAQLDSSKTQITHRDVLDQHAQDNTKSNSQLMSSIVEDVTSANGQDSCQTPKELNVSRDH